MNPRGLETAIERFLLCQRAFDALLQSFQSYQTDPRALRTCKMHWLDYLVQWKGAYSKIQQAAKDTPQERQWFGAVNSDRKNDPLLQYLYLARNDGEHGLDDTVEYPPFSYGISPRSGDIDITNIKMGQDGHPILFGSDGNPIDADILITGPKEPKLKEVSERDAKRKVQPPTSHLDQPVEPTPVVAAQLGLRWLASMIATAQAMQTSGLTNSDARFKP